MNIVIGGAGEVGRQSATELAAENHQITMIDLRAEKLESVADNLDVRTLVGSITRADTLLEAGADRAELFVAASDADETNLLAASLAKGLGAARVIARVHHGAYHDRRGIDYAKHFGIDRLVCPEYLTSLAIAGVIRDPAVQAVQHFARGQVAMERIEVSDQAKVLDKPLKDLVLPPGIRIGTVLRRGLTILPTAETVLRAADQITLVGATGDLGSVLPMFTKRERHRRRIVIQGGSSISVWLTRALDKESFAIQLYVADRDRAEELAPTPPTRRRSPRRTSAGPMSSWR